MLTAAPSDTLINMVLLLTTEQQHPTAAVVVADPTTSFSSAFSPKKKSPSKSTSSKMAPKDATSEKRSKGSAKLLRRSRHTGNHTLSTTNTIRNNLDYSKDNKHSLNNNYKANSANTSHAPQGKKRVHFPDQLATVITVDAIPDDCRNDCWFHVTDLMRFERRQQTQMLLEQFVMEFAFCVEPSPVYYGLPRKPDHVKQHVVTIVQYAKRLRQQQQKVTQPHHPDQIASKSRELSAPHVQKAWHEGMKVAQGVHEESNNDNMPNPPPTTMTIRERIIAAVKS